MTLLFLVLDNNEVSFSLIAKLDCYNKKQWKMSVNAYKKGMICNSGKEINIKYIDYEHMNTHYS